MLFGDPPVIPDLIRDPQTTRHAGQRHAGLDPASHPASH